MDQNISNSKAATFAAQLEKVQEALQKDPLNSQLLSISERLKKAIDLCTPKKPLLVSPFDHTIPNSSTSLSNHSFRMGDRVEARSFDDNAWHKARVLAVIGNSITVQFLEGLRKAQHCKASDVRPFQIQSKNCDADEIARHRRMDIMNAPVVHETLLKRSRPAAASAKRLPASSSSRVAVAVPKKPTKAEYIARKEAELKERQQNWLRFSQTLRK